MRPWTPSILVLAALGCGSKDDTTTTTPDDTDVTPSEQENEPPRALDDDWVTWTGARAEINVLLNDDDPEGKPLTLVSVTEPDDGGVTAIVSDTDIAYTPAAGFVGTAAFSYEVADKKGDTGKGIVRVTVLEPPTVTITSPAEGSEHVEDETVAVGFEVVGCTMADPDIDYTGCHLHKYVDGRAWAGNDGREHFVLGDVQLRRVDLGEHEIELRMAVNDGSDGEFDPNVADQVSIVVVPPPGTDSSAPTDTTVDTDPTTLTPTDTGHAACTDTGPCAPTTDTGIDTGITSP